MIHLLKNDHSGVPLELDLELLAGFQAEPTGVSVTDQQVSVAMHTGSEFSLAPSAPA